MKISEAFKLANNVVTSDSLIPIEKLKNKEYQEKLEKEWNTKFPSYEDIQKGIDFLGLDSKYFYATNNFLRPFYYKNDWILIDIHSFDLDYLESFEVKKRIDVNEQSYKDYIDKKDFDALFYLIINEAIRFAAFQALFDLIPDEKKYEIFISIYTTSEYGFKELDKDFVKKVLSYRSNKNQAEISMLLLPLTDEDGFIRIYRGIGKESTPSKESFSWTTDYYTALKFAGTYDLEGQIYTGKVHINNIIDFIQDRSESEVIIDPKNIIDFEDMNMKLYKDIVDEIDENGYLEKYHDEKEKIKSELFESPKGVHGVLHCKRVLMLTIMLSSMKELNNDDMKILIKAAQYHDIGRINDIEDYDHGKLSIEKMKKLKLFRNNKTQKDEILKFIIENHCIPDDIGFKNVNNYKIVDKEHAIYLLKVFKDADGLDRVRLSDLDVKYLRSENAKQLSVIAFLLKKNLY